MSTHFLLTDHTNSDVVSSPNNLLAERCSSRSNVHPPKRLATFVKWSGRFQVSIVSLPNALLPRKSCQEAEGNFPLMLVDE